MYMEGDAICNEQRTRELASSISTNAGEVVITGRDHYYPGGANDAEFMTQLRSLLQNSGEEMDPNACEQPVIWSWY